MFVRVKSNPRSYRKSILVCHSKRVNGKVKQFVIKNFGSARSEEEILSLKTAAENWLANYKSSFTLERDIAMSKPTTLNHLVTKGSVNISSHEIITKLYNDLGFKHLLSKKDTDTLIMPVWLN